METIIASLRQELQVNSNEKTKKSSQYFFKDEIQCYGIKSATVAKIGKEYLKLIKSKSKDDIFKLCTELWQSGNLEESFIACNWANSVHKQYKPEDLILFEKWIDININNWASCDTFCNHTVGTFIEMYPEYISELKRWTNSKNRWMRRAAAVSLIVPAKKGLFLKDVFEIADKELLDNEDMVQKGYGWMLKVAANKHEQEVFDYVIKNKSQMPRTSLRYAIEKMPIELKKQAMAK
jgi:3-methyladenine DNA glycosylase AlkD